MPYNECDECTKKINYKYKENGFNINKKDQIKKFCKTCSEKLERVDTIQLYDGNCYDCYISERNQLNKNNIISLRIKKPND